MDFQQLQCELLLDRWRNERQLGQPRSACGPTNRISDVAGVRVGHVTLAEGELQTGVTAIVPPGDNLYLTPLPCGAEVLNGFAKPVGLTQVEELGVLHTPILLSNTLAVGTLFTALVLECNDGWLNDIQALAISEAMAQEALHTAAAHFSRGSVGAGRGMSCFNLKGGIGTASRVIPSLNATLGVLVLANFGALSALTLDGVRLGEVIAPLLAGEAPQRDAGSVIIVMATDAPLDARQLKRIAKRAGAGLGRLGSYWGHGSGDIAVAFSTQPLPQPPQDAMLEPLLAAAADATEQAVLDALLSAEPVTGFRGHHRPSLTQILDRLTT